MQCKYCVNSCYIHYCLGSNDKERRSIHVWYRYKFFLFFFFLEIFFDMEVVDIGANDNSTRYTLILFVGVFSPNLSLIIFTTLYLICLMDKIRFKRH